MHRNPASWVRHRLVAVAFVVAAIAGSLPLGTATAEVVTSEIFANATLGPFALAAWQAPPRPMYVSVTSVKTVNAKLTVDFNNVLVADIVSIDERCTLNGTQMTCSVPSDPNSLDYRITMQARPGVGVGSHGLVTYTLSGDNFETYTRTVEVQIADGVDLSPTSHDGGQYTASPGGAVYTPASMANYGNLTTSDVSFHLNITDGMVPVRYKGCSYATVVFDPELGSVTTMSCPVGTSVAPGDDYSFVTVEPQSDGSTREVSGIKMTARADAIGTKYAKFEAVLGSKITTAPQPESIKSTLPPPGPEYEYRAVRHRLPGSEDVTYPGGSSSTIGATDLQPNNNTTRNSWYVNNTWNVTAVGATMNGNVGDLRSVTIGLVNSGKATLDISIDHLMAGLEYAFTVPPGVEVTKAPDTCLIPFEVPGGTALKAGIPGKPIYYCADPPPLLHPGEGSFATFELRINQVIPNATGTVRAYDFGPIGGTSAPLADDNPNDQSALVIVNPNGSAAGAGTQSPATTGSTQSTSKSTAAGSKAGTSKTAASKTSASQGGLSRLVTTGSPTARIAIGGMMLVTVGALLYLIGRRRRTARPSAAQQA